MLFRSSSATEVLEDFQDADNKHATRRLMKAVVREWDTLDKPTRVARALDFAAAFAKRAQMDPTNELDRSSMNSETIEHMLAAEAAARAWLEEPSRINAKAARRAAEPLARIVARELGT